MLVLMEQRNVVFTSVIWHLTSELWCRLKQLVCLSICWMEHVFYIHELYWAYELFNLLYNKIDIAIVYMVYDLEFHAIPQLHNVFVIMFILARCAFVYVWHSLILFSFLSEALLYVLLKLDCLTVGDSEHKCRPLSLWCQRLCHLVTVICLTAELASDGNVLFVVNTLWLFQ